MLNKNQQLVVDSNEQYIYINAGAGAGKTHTICQKIQKILSQKPDSKILCLTFTDMAHSEIKRRLENTSTIVKTFHKFILDIINQDGKYQLIEEYDKLPNDAILKISRYKNGLTKIKPFFYQAYENDKNNEGLIDFDDIFLIYLKSEIKHDKFDYIFIDEFQDTNNLQYKVIKKLISFHTKLICVGDNNQAIYRFRGSNYCIVNKFITEFNAKVFFLTDNYRSTKAIIRLANFITKKETIIPTTSKQGNIFFQTFSNNTEETETIISTIKMLINKGTKVEDICVLSRTNARLSRLKKEWSTHIFSAGMSAEKIFSTIHSIKGLEFKYVFLIGLETNTFPLLLDNTRTELEEEQRLLYVAITRAKVSLFASFNRSIGLCSVFGKKIKIFIEKDNKTNRY